MNPDLHHYVVNTRTGQSIWCESEQSAIALVDSYYKLKYTDVDRYSVETDDPNNPPF